MNISYNWLKEYLDFDLSPEETSAALTSIGLETGGVEEVQSIKGGLEGLVIGKVLTCEDHPNSDHLHVTTVDLGSGEPVQIVCGAPNVAAGQYVVVATIGTVLYDGDQSFTIKKSKIRGVESFGMICAEDEIGIGSSHDGIIVLPEPVAPGTPAKHYYNIKSDYVIEMDITPNRIDAASHYGVARDLSAYLAHHGKPAQLRRPSVDAFGVDTLEGAIEVEVRNTEACPRYAGLTIRGVKVAESPEWLKKHLQNIGLHPINNIVDITNYLLHAMCQPLHCFDLNQIKGGKVVVRTVEEGTKFVTLDGVERTLTDKDLMICNAVEPMCIAGVFGGLESGVTEKTTDIFLESAYFNPTWVRKTARRQGLNTDASFRYERGIDNNNLVYVLKLAALMVKELAGGTICGEIVDTRPEGFPPFPVTLAYDKVDKLIGKKIPAETVKSILKSLEIEITGETPETLQLLVPTYRVDVQRDVDVIEDVLRIYGYNNIEFTDALHANLSYKTVTDQSHHLQNIISEQLTGCGFNEIMCNSFTAASLYEGCGNFSPDRFVRLLNPLSSDLGVMRQTMLFGGLESIARNINRRRPDLRFYEFGNVYSFDPAADGSTKLLAPYSEHTSMGIWMSGNNHDANWNEPQRRLTVYDLKAVVDNIFARIGLDQKEIVAEQSSSEIFSASLTFKHRTGKTLGELGIIKATVRKKFDIDQDVFFAQFNWDALVKMTQKRSVTFTDLPKTQPVKRDLALLIDKNVTFAQIEQVVCQSERKLLRNVTLFDVYEGKNLEEGKKSYAISITLQDDEKTLQDKQIDTTMNKIIANLQKQLDAKLR